MGRISDDLCRSIKVRHLLSLPGGREAMGLWPLAQSWSNAELTDGFIPSFMVDQLGGWKLKSADLLVEVGLWNLADGGYQFHDWGDFNDTKQQVLDKRAKEARKKGHSRAVARVEKQLSRLASTRPSNQASPDVSPGDSPGDSLGVSTVESEAPIPTPDPILPPVVPRAPAFGKEPQRLLFELELLLGTEFASRRSPSQGAGKDQLLTACRRADEAVALGHFADAPSALKALVVAAVTAALRPNGKLGFALTQEPFCDSVEAEPKRQLSALALKTLASTGGRS